MKKKILKGVGILMMAGCIMTSMVKNVGAAENTANDVVNSGDSSVSEGNDSDGSSEKNEGTGKDNNDSEKSDAGISQGGDKGSDNADSGKVQEAAADSDSGSDIEEGKASDEGKDSEEKTDGEGEAKEGDDAESEALAEGEKESETEPEETLPEETLAETTAVETEAVKPVYLTMEDIAGTWTVDKITTYRFETDGKGALILPKKKYSFEYTLEENELKMDFENEKLRDSTFKVSLEEGVMKLQCLDEFFENEFTLEKLDK